MKATKRFTYVAADGTGRLATHTVNATDRADALRRLAETGATPLSLSEFEQTNLTHSATVSAAEASLVLRQLAVMVRAGVDLLEAVEAVADSLEGRAAARALRGVALALRRGEPLTKAFATHAKFYPGYVLALIRAGYASGRLSVALEEGAQQIKQEARLAREVQDALFYPTFLVASGLASVAFILYAVAPTFANMLGAARAELDPLTAVILTLGLWVREHATLLAASATASVIASIAFAQTAEGKRFFSALALATPGLGDLLRARERTSWRRIMAILLSAGLDVLTATRTSAEALTDGPLKRNATAAIALLRAGRSVDQAFLATNTVSRVEASVIAAGSRSGELASMFEAIAEKSEEDTRNALKRFTNMIEPVAIALVAGFIGLIVVGLVSALAGIYETIG